MNYPILNLRKSKDHSILRKHPWIFSGAIYSDVSKLNDGDIVAVHNHRDEFLAIGHFQHATISIRIQSFENRALDVTFFTEKLKNAIQLRIDLGLSSPKNSIFRICHGEGDGLPGLIIDFYNGVAVIQCHSIGMYRCIDDISLALQACLKKKLSAIYSKSSETLTSKNEIEDSYLFGTCTLPHLAMENSVNYQIDWINGQKTGFFIDQRENRLALGRYASGKKILNTFCYSGGFSLQALHSGASVVHSLDSSKTAIALTDENVRINTSKGKHQSIVADAMDYLKSLEVDYDIIVIDPPAFAKHRDKRHQAIQGYKRLNAHVFRQIKPGGIVFTFSCSQVVDKQLFTHTIIAAAIEAGRNVRILEQLHQPADHPINAFHPEGEYLKGLILQVE